ncbi:MULTISPECIES: hypothetical protein [Aphanothece]|uniref:hypothetical protein n=1 Tax=Aphanothece TaxID=1121 RepID=UPI00398F4EA1
MVAPADLRNPFRWYLALLLVGVLVSLVDGHPLLKFQTHRITEVLLAVGLLAWCFRPQSRSFFESPLIGGWYGLGLVGFAAVGLLAGAVGPVPWISAGFLGLALLQFALLPLLQPAWRQHRADTVRLLALFTVALVGMDLGFWLITQANGFVPYGWVRRLLPGGEVFHVPYLFMNPRWANQCSVLLLWTFVPLLQQLQRGAIRRWRGFWWVICAAVPLLCVAQIVASQGDGAFLAVALATGVLALLAWRGDGEARRLYGTAVVMVLASALLAGIGAMAVDSGRFFADLVTRNAAEITTQGSADSKQRLVNWLIYARSSLGSPLWGVGIQAVPRGSGLCGPHNLWLALLYWVGLLGTACATLLATGFVPRSWRPLHLQPMTAPFLVTLFTYQLVDDIWLRPLSLALLLVLLPALLPDGATDGWPVPPRMAPLLRHLALPAVSYRFAAMLGLLLIMVSVVVPGGVGFKPSPLVSIPGSSCLLFF